MKINLSNKFVLAGLIVLMAYSFNAISQPESKTKQMEYLLSQEISRTQNAIMAFSPSESLHFKALVTFHNHLLSSNDSDETNYLILDINQEQREYLQQLGFVLKPADDWINQRMMELQQTPQFVNNVLTNSSSPGSTIPQYDCYDTVEETYTKAAKLATDNPHIVEWIDIGDSWEKNAGEGGYDIMVLKITNKDIQTEKPKLLIHSAMHAREYATAQLNLTFAQQLINNYGISADETWLIDHREIHLLLHLNPDGRKLAEFGLYWRKNTNAEHCTTNSGAKGVDLNRNFSFSWAVSTNGSSGAQCAETYRGPSPASEPETQAIENYVRSIFDDNRGPNTLDAAAKNTQGLHLDIHSYSELILWPWGHTETPAPNEQELTTLGRKLAFWNNYRPMQSVGLYPTDGTSDNVSYGELGIPHMTFELGTAFFQSCTVFTQTIVPDNLPSLMYAAKVARSPYTTPAGPDATQLTFENLVSNSVNPGGQVHLSAMMDDTRYSARNGTENSQTIAGANVYIDLPPWHEQAKALPMTAVDNELNSNQEKMEISLDTDTLSIGQHTLFVEATDSDGNTGAVSAIFLNVVSDVIINQPPVAAFTVECVDTQCEFDGSTSSDDGSISEYIWNFGDQDSAQGSTAEHQYTNAGDFEVTLEVTDNFNLSHASTQTITVTEPVIAPPPPATPAPNSTSGGGAMSWWGVLLLLIGVRYNSAIWLLSLRCLKHR